MSYFNNLLHNINEIDQNVLLDIIGALRSRAMNLTIFIWLELEKVFYNLYYGEAKKRTLR